MIINKLDVISRGIDSLIIKELNSFTILTNWKFNCIKLCNDLLFVKPVDSSYVLAIDKLDSNSTIIGLWDTKESLGCTCNIFHIGLKSLVSIVIPTSQLNIYNKNVFDTIISKSVIIENRSFEILCRLINSPLYYNRSNKEMAIKALQLSIEFESNLNEVLTLLNSIE